MFEKILSHIWGGDLRVKCIILEKGSQIRAKGWVLEESIVKPLEAQAPELWSSSDQECYHRVVRLMDGRMEDSVASSDICSEMSQ